MYHKVDLLLVARAADQLMHAAQHLTSVGKSNYSNPAVWQSNNTAVIMLRERYQFAVDVLDYVRILEGNNVSL